MIAAVMGLFIYWLGRVSVINECKPPPAITRDLIECERGLIKMSDKQLEMTSDLLELSERIGALTKKGTEE